MALLLKRKVTLFCLGIDERYIIYCIRVTDVQILMFGDAYPRSENDVLFYWLYDFHVARSGGLTNTIISPLTKSIPTFLVCFFTISSSVSSSTSIVVTVSSTSPKIIFKCWSNAYIYVESWEVTKVRRTVRTLTT